LNLDYSEAAAGTNWSSNKKKEGRKKERKKEAADKNWFVFSFSLVSYLATR
jgi:hypothetical protein